MLSICRLKLVIELVGEGARAAVVTTRRASAKAASSGASRAIIGGLRAPPAAAAIGWICMTRRAHLLPAARIAAYRIQPPDNGPRRGVRWRLGSAQRSSMPSLTSGMWGADRRGQLWTAPVLVTKGTAQPRPRNLLANYLTPAPCSRLILPRWTYACQIKATSRHVTAPPSGRLARGWRSARHRKHT